MNIEIIKGTIVNKGGMSRVVRVGEQIDLDDTQASYLISINKAKPAPAAEPAPAKPTATKRPRKK